MGGRASVAEVRLFAATDTPPCSKGHLLGVLLAQLSVLMGQGPAVAAQSQARFAQGLSLTAGPGTEVARISPAPCSSPPVWTMGPTAPGAQAPCRAPLSLTCARGSTGGRWRASGLSSCSATACPVRSLGCTCRPAGNSSLSSPTGRSPFHYFLCEQTCRPRGNPLRAPPCLF